MAGPDGTGTDAGGRAAGDTAGDADAWDPDARDGDGAAEAASAVERAFLEVAGELRAQRRDTAAGLAALDRALASATAALGDLVRTERAGGPERLPEAAGRLGHRLDTLRDTAGELRDAADALRGPLAALRRIEALERDLGRIAARPAAVGRQRRALRASAACGLAAGLLMAALALWALPDRMETAAARAVMGASHWDAAWRMMDAHGTERSRTLRVLSWIDARPEEARRHRECRDTARQAGTPRRCAVTFRP